MVVASLSTSCVSTFHLKNKTYAPLVFDTITAKLDGNFTAEASLEFRFGAVKNNDYKRNFKQLYMSEYGYATNLTGKVGSMWNYRKAMLATRKDPTYNLALYNLAEKYPNIDYWTNIRVERTVHRKRSVLLGFLIKYLNITTHIPLKTSRLQFGCLLSNKTGLTKTEKR